MFAFHIILSYITQTKRCSRNEQSQKKTFALTHKQRRAIATFK